MALAPCSPQQQPLKFCMHNALAIHDDVTRKQRCSTCSGAGQEGRTFEAAAGGEAEGGAGGIPQAHGLQVLVCKGEIPAIGGHDGVKAACKEHAIQGI